VSGVLPIYGLLAVPLISRSGMNLGLISLSDKFDSDFDEGDLAIAQQFAAMAVAVLENIRLFSEVIQAQEVLKDQLEFNSLITHTLGEGLIAVDSLGAVTYFNPASRQLLFGKREIDDGQRIDRLVPLPDFEKWSLLAGPQGELQGEIELEGPPAREAGYVIRRMDDGWLVHLRDVTQERQGSRALQERDHFLSSLWTCSAYWICKVISFKLTLHSQVRCATPSIIWSVPHIFDSFQTRNSHTSASRPGMSWLEGLFVRLS